MKDLGSQESLESAVEATASKTLGVPVVYWSPVPGAVVSEHQYILAKWGALLSVTEFSNRIVEKYIESYIEYIYTYIYPNHIEYLAFFGLFAAMGHMGLGFQKSHGGSIHPPFGSNRFSTSSGLEGKEMELRLNCEVLKADGMGLDGIGVSKVEEEIRIE